MEPSIKSLPKFINKILKIELENMYDNEAGIQNFLKQNLLRCSFYDKTKTYKKVKYPIKNLKKKNADLILSDSYNNIAIVEIKFQKDKERASTRFERSVIDILYLLGEKKYNNTYGYLLYIDVKKTRYITDNNFIEAIESVVPIKLFSYGWSEFNNGNSEFILFEIND